MKQIEDPGVVLLRRSPRLRALVREHRNFQTAESITRFASLLLEHVTTARAATEDDLLAGGLEEAQARVRELVCLAEVIGSPVARDILGEQEELHHELYFQSVREALQI